MSTPASNNSGDVQAIALAIARLTAERDAARAEVEALREDAERYRWLRLHTIGKADPRGRQEFELPDPHPRGDIMRGSVAQHLDAAIDSARKAPATPTGSASS